jgi:hypothetical protein
LASQTVDRAAVDLEERCQPFGGKEMGAMVSEKGKEIPRPMILAEGCIPQGFYSLCERFQVFLDGMESVRACS